MVWWDGKVLIVETAANRQCHKDFATDVGYFSEAIKHNIRRQRPASVTAYAAVASDETKPSQVFTEPNVKANSARYRENAGRKRVSVVKNAYEKQYLSQCHHPEQCTGSHSRKHADLVYRTQTYGAESISAPPLPKEMRPPLNPKLKPVDFYT